MSSRAAIPLASIILSSASRGFLLGLALALVASGCVGEEIQTGPDTSSQPDTHQPVPDTTPDTANPPSDTSPPGDVPPTPDQTEPVDMGPGLCFETYQPCPVGPAFVENGLACVEGVCRLLCDDSSSCTDTEACLTIPELARGVCMPDAGPVCEFEGQDCAPNGDSGEFICHGNLCRLPCAPATPCAEGLMCVDNVCLPPPPSIVEVCGDGVDNDDNGFIDEDPCEVCDPLAPPGASFCPIGTVCRPDLDSTDGALVCLPETGTANLGEDCMTDPTTTADFGVEECRGNLICVVDFWTGPGGRPGTCAQPCDVDGPSEQCLDGGTCVEAYPHYSHIQRLGFCAETCDPWGSGLCTTDTSKHCAPTWNSPEGYCTVPDPDGVDGGVCEANSGGCKSGQVCMQPGAGAGYSCGKQCTQDADCPEPDDTCVPVTGPLGDSSVGGCYAF